MQQLKVLADDFIPQTGYQLDGWMDGWMDDMRADVLFNGISAILGRWEGGNKDCVQYPVFGCKDFHFKRVLSPGPLDRRARA